MPLDISCYVVYFMNKGNKAYIKEVKMKHVRGLEGKWVRLTQAARWRNYGDEAARIMPEGTLLRLTCWRPEGYNAVTAKGETFFLFAAALKNAEEL